MYVCLHEFMYMPYEYRCHKMPQKRPEAKRRDLRFSATGDTVVSCLIWVLGLEPTYIVKEPRTRNHQAVSPALTLPKVCILSQQPESHTCKVFCLNSYIRSVQKLEVDSDASGLESWLLPHCDCSSHNPSASPLSATRPVGGNTVGKIQSMRSRGEEDVPASDEWNQMSTFWSTVPNSLTFPLSTVGEKLHRAENHRLRGKKKKEPGPQVRLLAQINYKPRL